MVQPTVRFKVGAVSASVFLNDASSGEQKMARVSLQRVYKDKSGQFQYTMGLGVRDLPNAILALWQAWSYLAVEKREAVSE